LYTLELRDVDWTEEFKRRISFPKPTRFKIKKETPFLSSEEVMSAIFILFSNELRHNSTLPYRITQENGMIWIDIESKTSLLDRKCELNFSWHTLKVENFPYDLSQYFHYENLELTSTVLDTSQLSPSVNKIAAKDIKLNGNMFDLRKLDHLVEVELELSHQSPTPEI
jgi:hypothetical protein